MGHYSSFIVRVWIEPGEGLRWGIVQHVASRGQHRFSSMTEMTDFIDKYCDLPELSIPFLMDGQEREGPEQSDDGKDEGSENRDNDEGNTGKRPNPTV